MKKKENYFSLRACLTGFLMFFAFALSAQNITVKGSVTDETGEPVIGATVRVQGSKTGTMTNMDGEYLIKCDANATLEVSYIGYKTATVKVGNREFINLSLEEETTSLNEVVVTALGIKKDARKVGYAVSQIKSDEITKTASPSLGSALYGKAAGVAIKTAPGGATGAISINIRGLQSISGNNQPLIILDGVPIRNGEANNKDYWSDQRVNSNGLADINPEDIESLSILKGAAATAQYGSEGANGVVMITTKSGRGAKGFGVDFNASLTGNWVAYMPEYQTTFGPGATPQSRVGSAADAYGFYTRTDRNGVEHQYVAGTAYFGPKYDGRDVLYYDGTVRKFNAISSNPFSDLFRTGFDQQYNVAIKNATEKSNFRFSYTYFNSLPNQYNSDYDKHNFSLNGSYNILKNLKLDYGVNYLTEHVKNRPYRMYRLLCNFAGMFGAFDDIDYIRHSTVTTAGYRNRTYNSVDHENPAEGYEYDFSSRSGLVDEYLWNIYGKEQIERNNRIIAKVAPSWEIVPGLTLRGSLATDFTSNKIENKNRTETSNAFGSKSGAYELRNNRYTILYGDLMLMYDKNLTDKLNLSTFIGWSGRRETQHNLHSWTDGGLFHENWFSLNNSVKQAKTEPYEMHLLKTAWFGDITLGWDNWAYLEATLRNEKTSTLFKGNNSYWYPSVNASIIISELLKDNRPSWLDYGKVRASYGVVGLAPAAYYAVQSFEQGAYSGFVGNWQKMTLGNNTLKPEKTYEWEFGAEGKFLNNRLGIDVAYYTKTIKDQILTATMASSMGATAQILNVGEFKNHGLEIAAYGTPLLTKDWRIDLRGNIAWNRNKVKKLAEGIDRLEHKRWDNGAAYLYSTVGSSIGDFYAYAPQIDDKTGLPIIMEDGNYLLSTEPVKVGNAMPKYTGGLGATITYQNLFLDFSLDFRHGGAIFNMPYEYMMGRGSLKESMAFRDAAHGGQTYYLDDNANVIPASVAPEGKVLYDDGMILKGVKEDGTPNDIMISAARWYNWSYNWGVGDPTYYSHAIFNNSYVKVREIVIGYNFPKSITEKFHCNKLQVSAFARNPFYIYKNLPIFDAEATDATNWVEQSWIGGSTVTTRSFGVSLRASF
jgi:TonB-linked SusC/RagA family outer membrane protein